MSLRTVLADDEPLARRRLGRLLREAGCEVLAELSGSAEVLAWFESGQEADALFLDIQMPGLSGLEVLAELASPPPVVFVTAHVQYAVQAFEAAAVDYLLKPVTEDRLARTLDRLRQHQIPRRKGPEIAALLPGHGSRFPVRAGEPYRTSWSTLGEVEEAFPEEDLLRIHRHLLLRPPMVLGFRPLLGGRGEVRVAGGKTLEVSRSSVPKLKAVLGLAGKAEEA